MATDRSADSSPARSVGPSTAALVADGSTRDLSQVIGHHVRAFRKELGLSLRGLSERSGLSISFLSQLERGLSSIGLTTLRELAGTLGHEIVEFFDETPLACAEAEMDDGAQELSGNSATPARASRHPSADRYFTLTRSTGEHSSEYISGKRTYRLLSKRAPGLVLEPMLVSIAPGGVLGEQEVHEGEEFAYVLHGELSYTVEGVEHRLRAGDSLHLLSTIPHRLHNDTADTTVVVSVVTPRLF